MNRACKIIAGLSLYFFILPIAGCGLSVPEKDLLREDRSAPVERKASSDRGAYEAKVIDHIQCEIAQGLVEALSRYDLPWLLKWGTSVTLTFTTQEQGGFNPGISVGGPLENAIKAFTKGGNVTTPQSYSMGFGFGASTSAMRSETIQFTYKNSDLLRFSSSNVNCDPYRDGIHIDGDLKIRQFIFDKASIANIGTANLAQPPKGPNWALYNTVTEEIFFNSSFGGNINPSVKLVDFSANQSGSLLAAARSYSNDLVITLGPLKGEPGPYQPVELGQAAQNQHNAKVTANAISTAIKQ